MSVKYKPLPTEEMESVQIDFSSIYKQQYPKYFSYGRTSDKFKSAFTYSNSNPHDRSDGLVDDIKPSALYECCATFVTIICYILLAITFPLSAWFSFKTVQQHERLVVFRLGRLLAAKGPGLVSILPCIDKYSIVDLRMKAFSVPPKEIITADNAVIEAGAEVYFHIRDPILSVNNVKNLDYSSRIISQTTLQKHLSKCTVDDFEKEKANLCLTLQSDINKLTTTWGMEVERVEMSPIKILQAPPQTQASNPLSFLGPLLFPGSATSASVPFSQLLHMNTKHQLTQGPNETQLTTQHSSERETGLPTISPRVLLDAVKPHLSSSLVQDYGCVYQFNVTGEGGGAFFLDLKHGDGSAGEGTPPGRESSVDSTVSLSMDNLQKLLTGQLEPFNAYMGGDLEVTGNLKSVTQLGNLIELIQKNT